MKHGKKYRKAIEGLDLQQKYEVGEAVQLVQKLKYAKFNESLEVHIRLGVDPRNADQQVRGTVGLPHGTGKEVRVLVFAQGEHEAAARAAGADFVGGNELAEKVKGGWLDFDAVISTPDMMREVGKLGKVLGPRGLMPNPKTGTVTFDVAKAVAALKAGQVEYRVDRTAIIHAAVGKMAFTTQQLEENLRAYVDAVLKARPAAVKGVYMRSITIASTMGPGVKVEYESSAR
jgi:large subunit ribosomal protein L1